MIDLMEFMSFLSQSVSEPQRSYKGGFFSRFAVTDLLESLKEGPGICLLPHRHFPNLDLSPSPKKSKT